MSTISAVASVPVSLPPASNAPPQTATADQAAAAQPDAPSAAVYTAVASASASTIRGSNLDVVT